MIKDKKSAFTLVELLVIIIVIGVLSTFVVIAIGSSQVKARDSRRVSDLRQIQIGLEMFFAEEGHYPIQNPGDPSLDEFKLGQPLVGPVSGKTFMNVVPHNPTPFSDGACRASTDYVYSGTTGTTYDITYCIGFNTGDLKAGPCVAVPGNMSDCTPVTPAP